jgi:hypothetical protein
MMILLFLLIAGAIGTYIYVSTKTVGGEHSDPPTYAPIKDTTNPPNNIDGYVTYESRYCYNNSVADDASNTPYTYNKSLGMPDILQKCQDKCTNDDKCTGFDTNLVNNNVVCTTHFGDGITPKKTHYDMTCYVKK